MANLRRRRNQGVTLMELLTVTAIFAVLLGIAMTASSYAKQRATATESMSNLRQVAVALVLYREQNEAWPHQSLDALATGQGPSFKSLLVTKQDPFKPAYLQWYDECIGGPSWSSQVPTTFIHPFRRFPGKTGTYSMYDSMASRFDHPAILADRSIGTLVSDSVKIGDCDGVWDGPYHRVAEDTSVRRMTTIYRRDASSRSVDPQSFFVDLPVSEYNRMPEP